MRKSLQTASSLLVIAATVLSACGAQPTATTAPEATQPAAATTAPEATAAPEATQAPEATAAPTASDVVLKVTAAGAGQATWIRNFNPFSTNFLFPTQNGIYEPMMINNRIKGELVPWLASEYKWSDDLLTLTFTVRDGVKWSDGEPLTAGDVAFTFNLLKEKSGLAGFGLVAVAEGSYIDSVTAADATHVEFKFNRVYTPGFYDLIAQNIVPEHIWKDVADPVTFTNDTPVGSGPFTEVVSFADQVYEVDRNPNYWQPGVPAIKGLSMPIFGTNDVAATMFVNGDTEWTGQFFPNVDQAVIAQNPTDLHCWWPAVTSDGFFMMNGSKKPWDDPIVRKAVSLSFDREQLITVAFQGATTPADVTGLSAGYAAWKVSDVASLGDNWATLDVAKANQMLDEAGYTKGADGIRLNKDGTPIEAEFLMVNGFSDWLAIAPLVKKSLESLGFKITINNYDPGVTFGKWFVGDFDVSLYFGVEADTPYTYYRNLMSAETFKPVGEQTGFGENIWRVVVPEADEQLKIFGSTGDVAVQKEAALKLQQIMHDYAPVIPLWHAPTFYCYNDARVGGWASAENPFVRAMPIGVNSTGEQLLQMVAWVSK